MKPVKPPKMPQLDFLVNALNKRTEREKQILIGVLIAVAFILDYVLLLQPAMSTFSETSLKVGPLKQELKELTSDIKSKDMIQRRWEQVKGLSGERDKTLIAADETPSLLENLSQQAQRSGVKIVSLQPEDLKDKPKGTFAPFPISMKAVAGAHEFGTFLSNLETGTTFFLIKDLKITTNPADDRKHLIELSMEAYKRQK